MSGCRHEDHCSGSRTATFNSAGWRRVLWIALFINAGMFLAEMAAGLAAGSRQCHQEDE